MHAVYTILALAGVTLAQNAVTEALKSIPSCAIACLSLGSAAATSCGIADAYCQCTKGAADIKAVTQKCLCEAATSGKCTVEDLEKANKASSDICKATLSAKGETFSAAPAVELSACEGSTVSSPAASPTSVPVSSPVASPTSVPVSSPVASSTPAPVSSPVASSTPFPSEPAGTSSTVAAPISSVPSTIGPIAGTNITIPPAPYGGSNITTGNLTATRSPTITASELPTETGSATNSAPPQQTAGARATAAGDSFAILLSLGMLGMAAAGLVAM